MFNIVILQLWVKNRACGREWAAKTYICCLIVCMCLRHANFKSLTISALEKNLSYSTDVPGTER